MIANVCSRQGNLRRRFLPSLKSTSCVSCRLFQTEPDLKRLFPKIVQMNDKNELEWEVDKDMLQRHAVTVMEGLGAAVESLDDSDFLNSVLISIGQTHVKRKVKPAMLKVGTLSVHVFLLSTSVCMGL
ncbi:cytoglobin-1 [Plakobranchus ocellatus]|uniref:Globin n=1 Tax=Plakobranchus ocellatus TaxID=259542 RepID=A0AAV4BSH4_9GAST|nr:cytoglobin-1 [Plakobranchus ocellatus]